MTLEQLFQRFEKDLIYDAHGVVARYSRSSARKEIQKGATASVVEDQSFLIRLEIVRYLRSGKSLGEGVFQEDVETGWAGLLGAISRRESAF